MPRHVSGRIANIEENIIPESGGDFWEALRQGSLGPSPKIGAPNGRVLRCKYSSHCCLSKRFDLRQRRVARRYLFGNLALEVENFVALHLMRWLRRSNSGERGVDLLHDRSRRLVGLRSVARLSPRLLQFFQLRQRNLQLRSAGRKNM